MATKPIAGERPATKLVDWNAPVRSIDNPECTGIVKADDGINGKRPVAMRHDCRPWSADRTGDDMKVTTYRYDEYGRCHTHKMPSPYDLENFDHRTGGAQ